MKFIDPGDGGLETLRLRDNTDGRTERPLVYGGVLGVGSALMRQIAFLGPAEELFACSNTAQTGTAGIMVIFGRLSSERPVL